jgi:hypothetical protein
LSPPAWTGRRAASTPTQVGSRATARPVRKRIHPERETPPRTSPSHSICGRGRSAGEAEVWHRCLRKTPTPSAISPTDLRGGRTSGAALTDSPAYAATASTGPPILSRRRRWRKELSRNHLCNRHRRRRVNHGLAPRPSSLIHGSGPSGTGGQRVIAAPSVAMVRFFTWAEPFRANRSIPRLAVSG